MSRTATATILLLLTAGCEWLNWPDPRDHAYHGHRMIVHTAVIDSTAGQGTWRPRLRVWLDDGEFRRPGSGFDVFACGSGAFTVSVDSLNDPDTVDTFFVPHFDGLAQRQGGDTSHFARMDSLPGWQWQYRGSVAVYMAGRWQDPEYFMLALPDTVAPEVHLRVEIVWPPLCEYDWRRDRVHYDLDYLRITRIDAGTQAGREFVKYEQ
jgi:hypothetical protein